MSDGYRHKQKHACTHASSESLQRTKVLLDTFTPYQTGEKAQPLPKERHLLEEPNMADGAPKIVINLCKHKFKDTSVTPKPRIGAHFITYAPYCARVIS